MSFLTSLYINTDASTETEESRSARSPPRFLTTQTRLPTIFDMSVKLVKKPVKKREKFLREINEHDSHPIGFFKLLTVNL